jgi:radical SAM protein with 4Fe4S-binding SPASM domain
MTINLRSGPRKVKPVGTLDYNTADDSEVSQMQTIFPEPEPELSKIIVETTTACNIKCIHCAVSNEGYAVKTLRYESYENIVSIMKAYKPLVQLNGHGETLAHKRFLDMLDVAIGAGCRVVFQTNATLLVPRVSKRLLPYAGADKLMAISISIDGVGDVFDRVRRNAHWEEYVLNIKTFKDLRDKLNSPYPHLNFQFTTMLFNIHTLPATVSMVKELGGDALTVGDLLEYPTAAGQSITRDLVYSRPFYEEAKRVAESTGIEFIPFPSLVEALESIPYDPEAPLPKRKNEYATAIISWEKAFAGALTPPTEQLEGITPARDFPESVAGDDNASSSSEASRAAEEPPPPAREVVTKPGMIRVKDCTDPWNFAFIQADGGVRPCCWIPGTMGDINTQSFESIWHSKKYKDLRLAVAGPNPPPECWHCQARGWKWIPKPAGYKADRKDEDTVISNVSHGPCEGHLDVIQNSRIFGWAWRADLPDDPISVNLYVDEARLSSAVAGRYREDLERAGKGNGRHGFELSLPDGCFDGKPHSIRLCYQGTNTDLFGSPMTVCLERGAAPV